ncbi:MAG: hypothetical protein ACK5F7_17660 [Planctomycetaceae bacterium]|jgi:hypothetical protein
MNTAASPDHAPGERSPAAQLARGVIDRLEELILDADRLGRPLEVDPQRQALFELFEQADAGGFLADDSEFDLSADAVAKVLAERWKLRNLGAAIAQPGNLPPAQLARLRVLWSFMRMWMEWDYAWRRYRERQRANDQLAGSWPATDERVDAPPGDPD